MEIWDLYTADRQPTGKTMVRGEMNPEGLYNLSVTIWIKNNKGQYLISQRAANKNTYPLKWEPVGGGIVAEETTIQGAVREVREEVGINVDPAKLKLIFTDFCGYWNGRATSEFNDVYLYEIDEFDADKAFSDEVAQSKWLYRDEIKAMLDSGEFIDMYTYFFDKIDIQEEQI